MLSGVIKTLADEDFISFMVNTEELEEVLGSEWVLPARVTGEQELLCSLQCLVTVPAKA